MERFKRDYGPATSWFIIEALVLFSVLLRGGVRTLFSVYAAFYLFLFKINKQKYEHSRKFVATGQLDMCENHEFDVLNRS